MIGTTLSHFQITAKLGEGGMGEVYRATDTKLGREVAIKVLPPEMAANQERLERFQREAMALAALDHPNIVHIYSVESAEWAANKVAASDGDPQAGAESGHRVHFMTMQLVEGDPLDRLIPEGGLRPERIVEIGTAVAEALAAAHKRGIVHRDLKPANVMVTTGGRVKVLDFGLAKIAATGSDEPLDTQMATALQTREGLVMGTVPYMSPEQVAGRAVDARTDIFSLGVLLYEMASGQRPFAGRSSAELASAILRDQPGPLGERRADLAPALARVIERCLEKDPEARFATAGELEAALRQAVSSELPSDESRARAPLDPPPREATEPTPVAQLASGIDSGSARAEEGFWVAVLPFRHTGSDAEVTALAEGLSEEIVTGLSRFSYLRVISRSSTERFAGQAVDVRTVGQELGARYVLEGSLRQAGSRLRIAVQLVDTSSGAHLWAENYDRTFSAEAIFELQDELAPRIVATVADTHGVLPRSMAETLRGRQPDELTPYEAVLRSFAYFERVTAEELTAARSALELAVETAPENADAWAMIALLSAQEYGQGFGLVEDPLAKAAAAAHRAVEFGPSNHLAHFSLAQVLFFQKDFETFRNVAERAASLNPMDGNSIAFLGELLTYAGDLERGRPLADRAKQLNPTHPGWYWYSDFFYHYQQHDFPEALAVARKVNLPGHWGQYTALAVAHGQLGDRQAAGAALKKLLELRPDFADIARREFNKWWNAELVELMIDGMRKAGLEVDGEPQATDLLSGATRAEEGFWVAVLPFRHTGSDAEVTALAEGLSEEIVTGLARFSYLRVVSRSSTSKYANAAADVRTVGEEIGARYVMEGSLRQAGSRLRIAAQLVDTSSGAHLWAENYDRTFTAEAIFELQDELVPRIVSTVADWYGALPHSMSEAVRFKPADQLSPYEAVLRSFGYFERISPEEHDAVRAALEWAVEQAPGNADGWAMLSMMYGEEHRFGFNAQPESLERSLQAARRAVDAANANHFAWLALAQAHFFRREFDAFRDAAERAIALNSMDGSTLQYLAHLMAFSGAWERGCDLAERSRQLNPNHPGWYWVVHSLDAYRKSDYEGARSFLAKGLLRGGGAQLFTQALLAAVDGQLGDHEAARRTLGEVLSQKPDFAASAREEFGKWYPPELVEQLMEGLRKARLGV